MREEERGYNGGNGRQSDGRSRGNAGWQMADVREVLRGPARQSSYDRPMRDTTTRGRGSRGTGCGFDARSRPGTQRHIEDHDRSQRQRDRGDTRRDSKKHDKRTLSDSGHGAQQVHDAEDVHLRTERAVGGGEVMNNNQLDHESASNGSKSPLATSSSVSLDSALYKTDLNTNSVTLDSPPFVGTSSGRLLDAPPVDGSEDLGYSLLTPASSPRSSISSDNGADGSDAEATTISSAMVETEVPLAALDTVSSPRLHLELDAPIVEHEATASSLQAPSPLPIIASTEALVESRTASLTPPSPPVVNTSFEQANNSEVISTSRVPGLDSSSPTPATHLALMVRRSGPELTGLQEGDSSMRKAAPAYAGEQVVEEQGPPLVVNVNISVTDESGRDTPGQSPNPSPSDLLGHEVQLSETQLGTPAPTSHEPDAVDIMNLSGPEGQTDDCDCLRKPKKEDRAAHRNPVVLEVIQEGSANGRSWSQNAELEDFEGMHMAEGTPALPSQHVEAPPTPELTSITNDAAGEGTDAEAPEAVEELFPNNTSSLLPSAPTTAAEFSFGFVGHRNAPVEVCEKPVRPLTAELNMVGHVDVMQSSLPKPEEQHVMPKPVVPPLNWLLEAANAGQAMTGPPPEPAEVSAMAALEVLSAATICVHSGPAAAEADVKVAEAAMATLHTSSSSTPPSPMLGSAEPLSPELISTMNDAAGEGANAEAAEVMEGPSSSNTSAVSPSTGAAAAADLKFGIVDTHDTPVQTCDTPVRPLAAELNTVEHFDVMRSSLTNPKEQHSMPKPAVSPPDGLFELRSGPRVQATGAAPPALSPEPLVDGELASLQGADHAGAVAMTNANRAGNAMVPTGFDPAFSAEAATAGRTMMQCSPEPTGESPLSASGGLSAADVVDLTEPTAAEAAVQEAQAAMATVHTPLSPKVASAEPLELARSPAPTSVVVTARAVACASVDEAGSGGALQVLVECQDVERDVVRDVDPGHAAQSEGVNHSATCVTMSADTMVISSATDSTLLTPCPAQATGAQAPVDLPEEPSGSESPGSCGHEDATVNEGLVSEARMVECVLHVAGLTSPQWAGQLFTAASTCKRVEGTGAPFQDLQISSHAWTKHEPIPLVLPTANSIVGQKGENEPDVVGSSTLPEVDGPPNALVMSGIEESKTSGPEPQSPSPPCRP